EVKASLSGLPEPPRAKLILPHLLVMQHILNQVSRTAGHIALGKRLEAMERAIRAQKRQHRIAFVRRGLYFHEVFKWIVCAVRAGERGVLRAVERSAEVRKAVVRRKVKDQDYQLGIQIAVRPKKVSRSMANELCFN